MSYESYTNFVRPKENMLSRGGHALLTCPNTRTNHNLKQNILNKDTPCFFIKRKEFIKETNSKIHITKKMYKLRRQRNDSTR